MTKINLLVLKAQKPDQLALFYENIGLVFTQHRHGDGPLHYSSEADGSVFEIYPAARQDECTSSTRLGFSVDSLSETLTKLSAINAQILSAPKDTVYGKRAIVRDFEGHKVEIYQHQP